jgi:topoisomerase-4 subunit A
VKRFSFTESNNSPLLFISDARGSKLVDISSDLHPQVVMTFGGKFEHREPETLDAEEFIAKKGLTAKGKKCSPYDLKTVEFGEPLHKPEDDAEPAPEPEPMDVDIEDDFPEETSDAGTPIEQTGQSSALLKPQDPSDGQNPDDNGAVDFSDWEPTLF